MPENAQLLTREYCKGKTLLFYPKNRAEAEGIQAAFFDMGYFWGSNHGQFIKFTDACLEKGMLFLDDVLYTSPLPQHIANGLLCQPHQLPTADPEKYMMSDRQFMIDLFNRLSDRLDAIEAKIDAALPQNELDKTGLTPPANKRAP